MDGTLDIIVANDNECIETHPRGDAVGFRALLLDRKRHYVSQNTNLVMELTQEVRHSHISLALSLIFWLASVTACIWSFYTSQSIGLRIFTSMATIWTGLWTAYLAKSLYKPRLGELTVLSALVGFVGMLLTASTQLGLPLNTSGGIGLFAAAALLVAYFTYSRIGLITSISACLIWAALQFDGYLVASMMLLILPVLITGQIWLGAKLKSPMAVFAAMLVCYVWIGSFAWGQYQIGALSPLYLAAGISLIGGAHLQAAKAAEDEGAGSTSMHVLFAWLLTIAGLIGVQHYALFPGHDIWVNAQDTAPIVKVGWALAMGLSLAILSLSALIRRRHGRITIGAAFLLTVLYALLPAAVWLEADLTAMFTLQTGLEPYPAIGMFMGGIIIAGSIVFIANNTRRARLPLSVFGILIIAMQAELSLTPEFLTLENIVVLSMGIFLCLCFAVIIAQAQFDPKAPRQRLRTMRQV